MMLRCALLAHYRELMGNLNIFRGRKARKIQSYSWWLIIYRYLYTYLSFIHINALTKSFSQICVQHRIEASRFTSTPWAVWLVWFGISRDLPLLRPRLRSICADLSNSGDKGHCRMPKPMERDKIHIDRIDPWAKLYPDYPSIVSFCWICHQHSLKCR